FPRPHCGHAENGSTPSVTVAVLARLYHATAAMESPTPPTRKPTHGVHCRRGCGSLWSLVARRVSVPYRRERIDAPQPQSVVRSPVVSACCNMYGIAGPTGGR